MAKHPHSRSPLIFEPTSVAMQTWAVFPTVTLADPKEWDDELVQARLARHAPIAASHERHAIHGSIDPRRGDSRANPLGRAGTIYSS